MEVGILNQLPNEGFNRVLMIRNEDAVDPQLRDQAYQHHPELLRRIDMQCNVRSTQRHVSCHYDICHYNTEEAVISQLTAVRTGVRHGCLLQPFLFFLAIDWTQKQSPLHHINGKRRISRSHLDNLGLLMNQLPNSRCKKAIYCGGTFSTSTAEYPWRKEQDPPQRR